MRRDNVELAMEHVDKYIPFCDQRSFLVDDHVEDKAIGKIDDDEEDDMFTSSLVNDSIMTTPITRKRKPETSPEEVTDPEPPKASIEAAKVNINLDGKDLLKMLEIRGTSSSAYKILADK